MDFVIFDNKFKLKSRQIGFVIFNDKLLDLTLCLKASEVKWCIFRYAYFLRYLSIEVFTIFLWENNGKFPLKIIKDMKWNISKNKNLRIRLYL